MDDKIVSLPMAVATISDGARVGLGGNTFHRAPMSAVYEIVRQRKRGLEIVKTAGAYDVDLLCGAGCVAAVSAGYIGFESLGGLAPRYRRAVESGLVEAREHACYTVIGGLRAAIQGVPFMPVAGLTGSDLLAARGFQTMADPYSGQSVVVVPALPLDVAIVHVQQADRFGNGRIRGSRFEDLFMVKAARQVILTAEEIVEDDEFARDPDSVEIPGFLVSTVVHLPRGAWPGSCAGLYDLDAASIAAYLQATKDDSAYETFVAALLGG